MRVGMSMKARSAPERARQSEASKRDDHEGDAEFEESRRPLGDRQPQSEDQNPRGENRDRVPRSPEDSRAKGPACSSLLTDHARDRCDVVGLDRVSQAEDEAEPEDPQRLSSTACRWSRRACCRRGEHHSAPARWSISYLNTPLSSSNGTASANAANEPVAAMLRAARMNAPHATRASAEPTDTRRTPRSASRETDSAR